MMCYSLGQDGVQVFKKPCKLVEAVKRSGPIYGPFCTYLSRCLRQHIRVSVACYCWLLLRLDDINNHRISLSVIRKTVITHSHQCYNVGL